MSIVDATVRLIERALSWSRPISKLVLLSGTCYPIRPISELCRFLAETDKELINFVELSRRDTPELWASVSRRWYMEPVPRLPAKLDRFLRRGLNAGSKRLPIFTRTPPNPFSPCFGSQWWALSPESAKYVVQVYRDREDLRRFYRNVFAPDEQYIHTVLAASRFRKSMTQLHGGDNRTNQKSPLHLVFPSSDRTVPGRADLVPDLLASQKFFVRKVAPSSSPVLDAIDRRLLI